MDLTKIKNESLKNWSEEFFRFIQDICGDKINWYTLSNNQNISLDIIRNNMDKPWERYLLHQKCIKIYKFTYYENLYFSIFSHSIYFSCVNI